MLNNKIMMILIIFLGILSIAVAIARTTAGTPERQIIYRYIPRSFNEEQNEPVYASDIFGSMFTQTSPWVRSSGSFDSRKMEAINKYFISQY